MFILTILEERSLRRSMDGGLICSKASLFDKCFHVEMIVLTGCTWPPLARRPVLQDFGALYVLIFVMNAWNDPSTDAWNHMVLEHGDSNIFDMC